MTSVPSIDPEFKGLIPPLSTDELTLLESSITAEGCRDALVTWNGVLVDGHNRLEICTRLGIPYTVVALEGYEDRTSVIAWMLHNQLGRRNVTDAVRVRLALRLEPILADQAQIRKRSTLKQGDSPVVTMLSQRGIEPNRTRAAVAKVANVSEGTVAKVKAVAFSGSPDLNRAMDAGEISINAAYNEVRKPSQDASEAGKPVITRDSNEQTCETVTLCESCAALQIEVDSLQIEVERLNDQIDCNLSDAVTQAQANMPGVAVEIERLTAALAARDRVIADLHSQLNDAGRGMPSEMTYTVQEIKRIMQRGSDRERRDLAVWQRQQERDQACI